MTWKIVMKLSRQIKPVQIPIISYRLNHWALTSEGGHQRNRKNEESSTEIHNTEVLDEDEADNLGLDGTSADVDDDATVGEDGDKDDDKYEEALQRLGEDVDLTPF